MSLLPEPAPRHLIAWLSAGGAGVGPPAPDRYRAQQLRRRGGSEGGGRERRRDGRRGRWPGGHPRQRDLPSLTLPAPPRRTPGRGRRPTPGCLRPEGRGRMPGVPGSAGTHRVKVSPGAPLPARPRLPTAAEPPHLGVVIQVPQIQAPHPVHAGEECGMHWRPHDIVDIVGIVFKGVERLVVL